MSTAVDPRQTPLPLEAGPVSEETVRMLSSMAAAIDLCIRASGRDPKTVYMDLEFDKGHWSRILHGQAHYPSGRLVELMELCGNEIPLEWLAWQRGRGTHRLESELERENRELREQVARMERDRTVELRLLKDLRGVQP